MNRTIVRFALLGIFIVIVFAATMHIVTDDERLGFNDKVVVAISRPNSKYEKFTRYIDIYRGGEEVSVAAMEFERDELAAIVSRGAKDLAEIEPPDDELCRAFYRNSVAYIDNLREIVGKYKEVIAYMSRHNPGGKSDFAAAVKPLKELRDAEGKLLAATMTSQKQLLEKLKPTTDQ